MDHLKRVRDRLLTERDKVILRSMAQGKNITEVARELRVHRKTVANALTDLYQVLGVKTHFEAGVLYEQMQRR